uniref:Uncharacterized protein n=1 Tax=Kalmanozyma brasiliensis (strain GHG001) TaxID=1365824 RepID=V5F199_KALBG
MAGYAAEVGSVDEAALHRAKSGRFGEEAYADRSIPQAAPAKNSPTCAPAKKSCCPPRNDANQATERKIACSTNATDDKPVAATAAAASEPKEDDCCYGFVQCDVDGDKPAPALQAVSTAKETDLDGLKLKEDECCFGLVKCDAEGRIIM